MGQFLTHTFFDLHDLQSRLENNEENNEERLRSIREQLITLQLVNVQGQLPSTNEQDKDKEALQGTEKQSMLTKTNEQERTFQRQLKGEDTRVTELPSLPETNELEKTTRERRLEFQVQKELPREEKQRVIKLQSQLEINKKEIATMGEQLNGFQSQEEQLKEEQQRVTELQRQLEANEQELTTTRRQLNKYQDQIERLKDEQQRNTELLCWLETNEHEMITLMREQLNEFQGHEEQLREEQQRVTDLQHQLEANEKELTTMRGQLNEYQGQIERLKEEQQRNTELQGRLETNEHEMITMREQLNEFQGQEELLRVEQQRVTELQSQSRRQEQEMATMRDQLDGFQSQDERLREEQQRVTELQRLLETYEQEMTTIRDQQREIEQNKNPRDWVIYRYEILKTQELGRGAWGIVYRGKFNGCDVAVKEMHEALIDSDHNRYLFEREVEIASRCRHPCLLQFIGATSDERPLLVTEIMEYSLRERLYNASEKTLSTEEVSVISLDVARALNYLHQKPEPIIHHDISSANVLLWQQGDQWRAKVSDYGTANFVRQSNINYAGAVIYCAPESLNEDPGQPISCKVDVYSFGVLLCEMCITQQPDPQQRENQIARMRNRKFQNLVRRCVTREPWERPNIESVIVELEKPALSCSCS